MQTWHSSPKTSMPTGIQPGDHATTVSALTEYKAPVCKDWCRTGQHQDEDWATKCDWENCNGCDECATKAPTPSTPAPAEGSICKYWCRSENNKDEDWATKCKWANCNGCDECATEATPTPAPTQAPTLAPTRAPTQAPTLAPTQAPTPAPPPAEVWFAADAGSTCDIKCGQVGKVCNPSMMSALTTAELMMDASTKAGYPCSRVEGARDYAGAPFFKRWQVEFHCYFFSNSSGKSAVCDGNTAAWHSPICYCEEAR